MTLRERIEGLVADWKAEESAYRAIPAIEPYEAGQVNRLIRCIKELAAVLVAEGPNATPVLIAEMREFAEECLRRIAANPHTDGNELHTKHTYEDILKLCDAAAPSLHKEASALQKVAAVNSSVSLAHSAFLSQQAAALHKEGAGGELAWLIEKGGLCLGFCARKFTWLAFTDESALRFSRRSDAIRFIQAMRESMKLDDVLVTEHMWAASPVDRAEQTGTGISTLALEPIDRAIEDDLAVTKLWRISQAVKLQSDPAQLQQFYDYVKGVVGE